MRGYLDELEYQLQLIERPSWHMFRIVWTASREWPSDLYRVGYDLLDGVAAVYGRRVRIAHGAARGGDQIAARFAPRLDWAVKPYPVSRREWDTWGGVAGHQRNARMLETERPDLVIALIHNRSRGATGCRDNALARGIPCVTVDDELALLPRVRAML